MAHKRKNPSLTTWLLILGGATAYLYVIKPMMDGTYAYGGGGLFPGRGFFPGGGGYGGGGKPPSTKHDHNDPCNKNSDGSWHCVNSECTRARANGVCAKRGISGLGNYIAV